MSSEFDTLRSELEGKLDPPLDVMLDPSLLVAESSRSRLPDAPIFEAQTQATLGQTPTQPRIDSISVPHAFFELVQTADRSHITSSASWNFFRGQADGAAVDAVATLFGSYGLEAYDGKSTFEPSWEAALAVEERTDRLVSILAEIAGFLADGGVLLSRTPASLETLRDGGVTTVDLGQAELRATVRADLLDIGHQNPASISAIGIESGSEVAQSLVGDLLNTRSGLLVYRIGG